jgi:spermidine/putrescine-binding protein
MRAMPIEHHPRRRAVLMAAAATALAGPALASSRRALAEMTEGPFYPPRAWREAWPDQDADLSRVRIGEQLLQAQGEHLGIELVVADTAGRLIDQAEIEAQGWDAIWNATAFKGQVSILDDDREAFIMAMLRKGITDINTTDKAIVDQALADVTELIDLVSVKVNIEGYKDIPEGTTTIAHTWSADLITGAAGYMPEGVSTDVLGFWHPPSDRYLVANDSMGVLAGAESPVLAHLYLNFLLDNDVAEKNFSFIGYLPALSKLDADYVIAQGYVPENLRNCVPTNDDITKGLVAKPLGLEGDVLYEQAWSTFRTGA